MTVFVNRDAVDWLLFTFQVLSLVGTVAAAWFAYLAIRQAKAQEGQAQKALIHERRLDFELDVLRDLALAVPRLDTASMTGLAVMLPVADIPLTRASLHLTSTPLATRKVELGIPPGSHPTSYVDRFKNEIVDELLAATKARVDARHPT